MGKSFQSKPLFSQIVEEGGKLFTVILRDISERIQTERALNQLRQQNEMIAEGHSNKTIASILDISIKTVEFHKSKIMERVRAHTTAELKQYAFLHGGLA